MQKIEILPILPFLLICLFSRCFNIIDSSAVEQVSQEENVIESMDTQEGIIGMGLASTLHTVLIQTSPKIFSV